MRTTEISIKEEVIQAEAVPDENIPTITFKSDLKMFVEDVLIFFTVLFECICATNAKKLILLSLKCVVFVVWLKLPRSVGTPR